MLYICAIREYLEHSVLLDSKLCKILCCPSVPILSLLRIKVAHRIAHHTFSDKVSLSWVPVVPKKKLILKSKYLSFLPVSELAGSPVRVDLEKVGHFLHLLLANLFAKEGSNSFSLALSIGDQFLVPSDPHPRVAPQWPKFFQLSIKCGSLV